MKRSPPMAGKFKKRLVEARAKGDMTTADVACWFDRPYATVRYWIDHAKDDYEPSGPRGRLARDRLALLEWAISHRLGFPIPPELSVDARPLYVKKTYNDLHAQLSRGNPTR